MYPNTFCQECAVQKTWMGRKVHYAPENVDAVQENHKLRMLLFTDQATTENLNSISILCHTKNIKKKLCTKIFYTLYLQNKAFVEKISLILK